jgi:branched-chain amino acid transport system substrate-binding protein
VLEQTYEVTDPTIDSQIVHLKNSGANVFYDVTIPKFAVQAIKKANDIAGSPCTRSTACRAPSASC